MEALRREMEALRREIRGAHGMHRGMRPPPGPSFGFGAPVPPKAPGAAVGRARIATAPAVSKRAVGIAMPKGGAAGTSFYAVKPAAGKLEAQVKMLQAEIAKQNALIHKLLARMAKLEANTAK